MRSRHPPVGSPETLCIQMFPRRKTGNVASECSQVAPKRGRDPAAFTMRDLNDVFELPLSQAANQLGIAVTSLKKICRIFGIRRWPYARSKRQAARQAPGRNQSVRPGVRLTIRPVHDSKPPVLSGHKAQGGGGLQVVRHLAVSNRNQAYGVNDDLSWLLRDPIPYQASGEDLEARLLLGQDRYVEEDDGNAGKSTHCRERHDSCGPPCGPHLETRFLQDGGSQPYGHCDQYQPVSWEDGRIYPAHLPA